MKTVNEIISGKISAENFSDAEITEIAYGIENFDLGCAGIGGEAAIWWLKNQPKFTLRLESIKKPITSSAVKLILCSCGHESAHPMSASSGSSCSDCYDKMSN